MSKQITARAKAFAGHGTGTYRFEIDGEEVRVWDSIAGHYTLCHSLSESAKRRILKLAREAQS